MSDSGYLEGQLYSTGGSYDGDYYERLKKLGKASYTSPDITVLNRWDKPAEDLDKRFGFACSRRDSKFERYGEPAVTFPRYQRHALSEIEDKIGMPIYIVFGRSLGNGSYSVGVTELREPDETMNMTDQSTGNARWTDIYKVEALWSWEEFIAKRIEAGDREPNLDSAKKLAVPRFT